MTPDMIDDLYDALKADGVVEKSKDNFRNYMLAPGDEGVANRKALYEALKADGAISSPTQDEFEKRLDIAGAMERAALPAQTTLNTGAATNNGIFSSSQPDQSLGAPIGAAVGTTVGGAGTVGMGAAMGGAMSGALGTLEGLRTDLQGRKSQRDAANAVDNNDQPQTTTPNTTPAPSTTTGKGFLGEYQDISDDDLDEIAQNPNRYKARYTGDVYLWSAPIYGQRTTGGTDIRPSGGRSLQFKTGLDKLIKTAISKKKELGLTDTDRGSMSLDELVAERDRLAAKYPTAAAESQESLQDAYDLNNIEFEIGARNMGFANAHEMNKQKAGERDYILLTPYMNKEWLNFYAEQGSGGISDTNDPLFLDEGWDKLVGIITGYQKDGVDLGEDGYIEKLFEQNPELQEKFEAYCLNKAKNTVSQSYASIVDEELDDLRSAIRNGYNHRRIAPDPDRLLADKITELVEEYESKLPGAKKLEERQKEEWKAYAEYIDKLSDYYLQKYGLNWEDKLTPEERKTFGEAYSKGNLNALFNINTPSTATYYLLKDTKNLVSEAMKHAKEWSMSNQGEAFFRGLWDRATDWRTWTFGIMDHNINRDIERVADKFLTGKEKLTESEELMLDALALKAVATEYLEKYIITGYDAGKTTADAMEFMAEMAVGEGAWRASAKLAQGAISKLAKFGGKLGGKLGQVVGKLLQKYGAKFLNRIGFDKIQNGIAKALSGSRFKGIGRVAVPNGVKTIARWTGKTVAGVGEAAGKGVVNTLYVGVPHVMSTASEYRRGQVVTNYNQETGKFEAVDFAGRKDPLDALTTAFLSEVGERGSEFLGDTVLSKFLKKAGGFRRAAGKKVLDTLHLDKASRFLAGMKKGDMYRAVADFKKFVHYNGTLGEYLEEVANNIYNAAVVHEMNFNDPSDEHSVFNLKNNVKTYMTCKMMGGAFGAVNAVSYRTPMFRARKAVERADDFAKQVFNANGKDWSTLSDFFKTATPEKMEQMIVDIARSENYTPAQRQAALNYAGTLLHLQGLETGEAKVEAPSGTDAMLQDLYGRGYNAETVQSISAAIGSYEKAKRGMSWMPPELLEMIDEDAAYVYDWAANNPNWSEQEKQQLMDYINARATYEGAIQRLQDDTDAAIAASEQAIDLRTNKKKEDGTGDGLIHPAVLKNGQRVYITGGEVTADDAGTISSNQEEIIVVDEAGKTSMIPYTDIKTLEDPSYPEEEMQTAAAAIQAEAEKVYGTVPEDNEEVDIITTNGVSTEVNGDGNQQNNDQVGPDTTTGTATATNEDTQGTTPAPIEYKKDDTITVEVDGQRINGQVTREVDDSGNMEIYVETPVNNSHFIEVTPEELNGMLVNHTPAATEGTENVGAPSQQTGQQPSQPAQVETPNQNVDLTNPGLNDEVTLTVNGEQVTGTVDHELDDNGTIGIHLDSPINGAVNIEVTPEQLMEMASQPEQAAAPTQAAAEETVSQQPNGELDVQTGESSQQSADVAAPTAEQAEATTAQAEPIAQEPQAPAQPSLPIGEDGNADFSNATPQEAHDYIYNDPDLDEEEADQVVQNYADQANEQLAQAQAALDQAESVPAPVMKDYGTDVAGYKRAKKQRNDAIAQAQAAVAAAQRGVDLWNGVQAQRMMVRAQRAAEQRAPIAGENGTSTPVQGTVPGTNQTQLVAEPTETTGATQNGVTSTPSAQEQPQQGAASAPQNGESRMSTTSGAENAPGAVTSQPGRSAEEMTADERINARLFERLKTRAKEIAAVSGVPSHVIEDIDDPSLPESYRRKIKELAEKGEMVEGWYDTDTGHMYFYLPGIPGLDRLDEVYAHETVAHGGMRLLLRGKDGSNEEFEKLCDNVWGMMSVPMRARFMNYVVAKHASTEDWKDPKKRNQLMKDGLQNQQYQREAADEYMAKLSEIYEQQKRNKKERSTIMKVLDAIRNAIRRHFKKNDVTINIDIEKPKQILDLLDESRRNLTEMDAVAVSNQIDNAISNGAGEANAANGMFSTTSIFEGAGFEVQQIDENGNSVPMVDSQGNMIVKLGDKEFSAAHPVTVQDLKPGRNREETSVLQMLINDAKAFNNLSDKKADKIYQNYADILNMYLYMGSAEMGGPDAVERNWEWLGDTVFRTIAANGDAQYSYSMDIIRVCKKNEAVIKAMSAHQLLSGRGATPSEIVDIYRKTYVEGYQVPCPVCYVFTRYIRNGKYASAAIRGMETYGDHLPGGSDVWTAKQWADELDRLNRLTNPDYKPDGKNKLEGKEAEEAKRFKDALDKANEITVKYEKRLNALSFELTSPGLTAEREQKILDEIKVMDAQYQGAIDVISFQALTNWIKTHAIEEKKGSGWKLRDDAQKPADIDDYKANALDLRLTANTIVNYPAIQRLRKSGGSAAGKEISFASNNELGEVVSGLGISSNKLSSYANPYQQALLPNLTKKQRDDFRKKARDRFKDASTYAAMQTLRGGQRMWSWSDNIERLSPDVAINLIQLELLNGAMQTYSKQLEGVKLAAQMGAYVNGSLMAKDNGWLEVSAKDVNEVNGELWLNHDITDVVDEPQVGGGTVKRERVIAGAGSHVLRTTDGKLVVLQFDDIIGIDPYGNRVIIGKDGKKRKAKGLFELNEELDKAGNILVGMNDLHIRAALADPRVFFVIPWHSSGANNHILAEMFAILEQRIDNSVDYTDMQEEKNMGERNKDTKALPEVIQKLRDLWEEGRQWAEEYGWKSGMEVDSNGDVMTESQYMYRQLRSLIFSGEIFEDMPSETQYSQAVADVQSYSSRLAEIQAELDRGGLSAEEKKTLEKEHDKIKPKLKEAQHTVDLHDGMIDWRDSAVHKNDAAWNAEHPKRISIAEARKMILADEFLKQVYNRVKPIGEMTSKDNTFIYPYEYWDENSTYDNADINGKRYVEYCRRMGYKPKFAGNWKTKDVSKQGEGDFVHDPGYWKLLIDRRMYDRAGKYQWLDPVTSEDFNTDLINPMETQHEFHVTTVADDAAADAIASKVFEEESKTPGGFAHANYDKPLDKVVADFEKAMEPGMMFSTTPSDVSEEEREVLMGIHNITGEKLRSAIGLGGLANPSMAVVDTTKGLLNNFGEISLIPGRDLIDKKTGRNAGTFTADAYTPRFPTVHRRLGKGGEKKLNQWLKSLGMRKEMEYNTTEQFNDWVNGFDIQDNALVYPFLHEKGLSAAVDQEDHNEVSAPFREIVGRYHGDINAMMDAFDTNEEVRQEITDIIIDDILKQEAPREDGESWKDFRDRRRKWRQLVNEAYLDFAGFVDRGIARTTLEKECGRYSEGSRFNPEASRQAASLYIDKNGMRSEYTQWREQRFAELGVEQQMYAGSDREGRSKYKPITLESVSRAMKKQGLAGGESSFFSQGPGGVRARLTPRLTSLNQIRNERGRIQNDIDEILEGYSEELSDTASNMFANDREALADVLTSSNMKAKAKELGFEISDATVQYLQDFKNRIMELPTEYFETKFERPVMLNEFEAAVVPNDVDSEIREALEAEGLDVREYDPEVAGDRERVTLEAAQDSGKVLFSTSAMDSEYMAAVESGDKKKVEKMVKEAARLAMPNTKVVDRWGKPRLVFHGTASEDKFNVFNNEDIYLTSNESHANQYTHKRRALSIAPFQTGRVMPCFVNIENPLVVDANRHLWRNIDVDWSSTPVTTEDIAKYAKENGYDGVIIKKVRDNIWDDDPGAYDVFVAFNSSQVKSAGPTYETAKRSHFPWDEYEELKDKIGVTYDDNGDVIPLSERFDLSNKDIRWSTNRSLGAPYQGTKGRIASQIVDDLPSGERFVDLFAGGGAVTHAAILSGKYGSYHMNDINPVGQELFLQGVRGEWEDYDRTNMTPEEFNEIKGTPESLPWSYNGLGRNLVKGGRPDYINRMRRLGELKPYADDITSTNEDYRDVEIRPGDVVYADIPYEDTDTRGYGKGRRFDKKAFCDWAQSQDFPIFVSEYTMPEGWVEIDAIEVGAMRRNDKRTEKLWVQEKFAGEYNRNTEQEPEMDGGLRFSVREKPAPQKTQKVYKLMRLGDDGGLYPLFIDGTEPIELGVWYDADSPNMDMLVDLPAGVHLIDTENGTSMTMEEYYKQNGLKLKNKQKYPSKEIVESTPNGQRWVFIEPTERAQRRFGGEARRYWNIGINGSGSVSTFSMRPGWHAGSLPTMRQIGKGANRDLRDDRFVWVEGLISADIDYNEEAQGNPDNDIPTHIPTDGFYMKATNANAKASQADRVGWYISGAFMPVRIMSDSEARQVIDDWNQEHPDLQVEYDFPRESGKVFNAETMQLEDEPEARFSTSAAEQMIPIEERYPDMEDFKDNTSILFHYKWATRHLDENLLRLVELDLDDISKEINSQKKYIKERPWAVSEASKRKLEGLIKLRDNITKELEQKGKAQGNNAWGIKRGTNFTFDQFDKLFKAHNSDPINAELWDKVLATSRALGIDNIKVVGNLGSTTSGASFGGRVRISEQYLNSYARSDNRKAETMLHEMIHHVTSYAFNAVKEKKDVPPYIADAVRILNDVFNAIESDPDFNGQYGKSNVHELVAELSNPEFREKLKEKNLWQKIVDGLMRLLGYEPREGIDKTNAYTEARAALEKLLENPDADLYKEYAEDLANYRPRFKMDNEVRFSTSEAVAALKDDERVYNDLLGKVFSGVSNETRRGIVGDAMENRGNDFGAATESWLMGLADNGKFAQVPEEDWRKVKDALSNTLRDNGVEGTMTDNEARYVLWKAGQIEDGVFSMAEDIVKQDELLNGARAPQYTDSADVRFSTSSSEEESGESGEDLMFSMSPRDRSIARDQYERWMGNARMQWSEAMQDSMLGLKKLMQAIVGKQYKYIEDIPMYENAYVAENLMSSVTAAEQAAFYRDFMKPLLKQVSLLCKGKKKQREEKRQELNDYLMAKHGLERNVVLADRDAQETAADGGNYQDAYNENRKRDYSGLTELTGENDVQAAEAAAQQMVAAYEAAHDTTELWTAINAATHATLEKQYQSGILSKASYEKIRDMFEYYVPLRGWDETTSDEVYGYLTSNAGPILGGSIMKRAGGRTTKADDPIANISMLGDDSVRTGNRNLMKQNFLRFVENHPSDLVSVSELWLQYDDVKQEWIPVFANIPSDATAEKVVQIVEQFEADMAQLAQQHPNRFKRGREAANIPYRVIPGMEKEHQVLVKRGGRTYVLTINGNPRAAQALNGITNPDVKLGGHVSATIRFFEKVNRFLSSLYTTYNPAFIVSNFLRDSIYSNNMVWIKEKSSWKLSKNYPLKFNINYYKTNPVTMRRLLGKWENGTLDDSKPMQKMFKEFMEHGGETGYAMAQELDDYKKKINKELGIPNSKRAWKRAVIKATPETMKKMSRLFGEQYELLGRSIENCARFAAFMTSRQMGRSVERAAYDAKEISVNFNKKGAGGKVYQLNGQTRVGNIAAFMSGWARNLYTFWNAGVQGMTNIGRAAKRHPAKAAAMLFGKYFAMGFFAPMLGAAMSAALGDDDKNAYYNLPEYVRRSNICIWAGGAWITIPLPIELRAIYGLGELTYGWTSGNERYDTNELVMQYASQLSQIMPIDMLEGGGGFHPFIPTLLKPIVEAEQNVSWSGTPIYKDTPFNKDDPEWTKAFSNTSGWLVASTEMLNAITGGDEYKKGWLDWNPAKIEYLLKGYLGGLYSFPNDLMKTAGTLTGSRDFEWRNIPLANRVLKQGDERLEAKKLKSDYFRYKEEYEKTKRLLDKYSKAESSDLYDYAKKLDILNHSKEYRHYEIFKNMDASMVPFREKAEEARAEGDMEIAKQYEDMELELMRQMVKMINDSDDGKAVDPEMAMRKVLMHVLDTATDATLRGEASKELAKSHGAKDSLGNNDAAYNQRYVALRNGTDVDEDAQLQKARRNAKDLGETELYEAFGRAIDELATMRKGVHAKTKRTVLGLGEGDAENDKKIMEKIRQRRREILKMSDEEVIENFPKKRRR